MASRLLATRSQNSREVKITAINDNPFNMIIEHSRISTRNGRSEAVRTRIWNRYPHKQTVSRREFERTDVNNDPAGFRDDLNAVRKSMQAITRVDGAMTVHIGYDEEQMELLLIRAGKTLCDLWIIEI